MNQNSEIFQIKDWLVENLPYKIMWMDEQDQIVYANEMFLK